MNPTTQSAATAASPLPSIALSVLLGVAMIFVAGFAQPEALHDAAHDVRHAAGFPCH